MKSSVSRPWVTCLLLVLLAGFTSATYEPLWGQEEEPQKSQRTQRQERRGRLPAYYARVVSGDQRESVYKIQRSYAPKLQELTKQLQQLRAMRDKEIDAILTPEQLARVKQLREEARQRRRQNQQENAEPIK